MANLPRNIKSRLADLGKSQIQLLEVLRERGYELKRNTLSQYVTGARAPGNPHIMTDINLIISRWEQEKENKKRG